MSAERYASLVLPVPPRLKQKEIVNYLDREAGKIGALVGLIERAIDRVKELRTALISAAVTGKIDVRGEAA